MTAVLLMSAGIVLVPLACAAVVPFLHDALERRSARRERDWLPDHHGPSGIHDIHEEDFQ